MVHEGWIDKPWVRHWLKENPSVQQWLTKKVTKPNTQYDYGYNLMRFCEGVGESPERLLQIRLSTDGKLLEAFREKHMIPHATGPPDKNGEYVILDLLQAFIREGTLTDMSVYNFGAEIKVAELGKSKRSGLYNAVRAYFKAARATLPQETFKIDENSRVVRKNKDFTMEGRKGIEEAKDIIKATKEPYKSLFWAALYGGMGDAEICTLNEQWGAEGGIRKQLKDDKDPVKVEFLYRKSNEQKYYTFVPARIFRPYAEYSSAPFLTLGRKGEKGGGQIDENHLVARWRSGRDRTRTESEVGVHNLRDLWRTCAVKAGVDSSVAEFFVGHTIDSNRYNQIYKDVPFMVSEWEKMRKFIDGETEEWRKPVEELRQRLDKTEYERRDDMRQANLEFLRALPLSPKQIQRIREEHDGDFANITKEDRRKIGEQVKVRLGLLKPAAGAKDKPSARLRVTKEEAELLMEQGWEELKVFDSGNVLLEWRYATPPPKRPSQSPSR
jgi:hypothetical protein